jgi:hypothetical protein
LSSHNKYFDNFTAFNTVSVAGDAVDEWLNTPAVSNISNGLQYWTAMGASGHPLAPMAKNFLSALVCTNLHIQLFISSTDVERAFSRGRLTVSKMRHSLSDESTRAASVLGAWCDLEGAVPRDEIMEVFKDKGKRPKYNNILSLPSEMSDVVVAIFVII